MKRIIPSIVVSTASVLFAIFYFTADQYGEALPILSILCAGLPILILALVKYRKLQHISLRTILLLLIGLVLFWTNSGLAFYRVEYLIHHPFLAQWNTIGYLAYTFFIFFCFLATTLLIGDYVLVRLFGSRKSISVYAVQAIGIGSMVQAIYLYILSLFSLVYPLMILLPLSIFILNRDGCAYYYQKRNDAYQVLVRPIPIRSFAFLFWVTLALVLSIIVVQASYPLVVEGDSLALYFNLPDLILKHHALISFPYSPVGNSVFAFSFVYIPLLFFGERILNYAALYFFCLSIPLVYTLSTKVFADKQLSWLTVWLYVTTPMLLGWLLITPKIDLMVIFFVSSGLLFLSENSARYMPLAAALGGAMIGFSVAIKFNTVLLAMALLVTFLGLAAHYRQSMTRQRIFLGVFFFLGIALSFGFWGARTFYYHQNFFYPYSQGRLYDALVSSPQEKAYMDAFYKESDYYNANFGFSHPLIENVQHYFTNAIRYPSFNYGLILIAASLAVLFWKKLTTIEKVFYVLSWVVIVEWYVLVRNVAHYMDFILPLLAILSARTISSVGRNARIVIVGIMVLTLFYSISLNPLLPAVFMTGAESVATVTVRPADALQDEMNAIIDHNPKAVFLAVNTPAPHAIDNHLHRFDNTSDFYLAHIFFNAPTPQDAINALRHDDITHLLYRIPNADAEGLLNICRARGSACPLYQAVIEKKEELRVLLHAVVEKNNTVIYEL